MNTQKYLTILVALSQIVRGQIDVISTLDDCRSCYGLSDDIGFLEDRDNLICREYNDVGGGQSFCCQQDSKEQCELTEGYLCQPNIESGSEDISTLKSLQLLTCPPVPDECGGIDLIRVDESFTDVELNANIATNDGFCSYKVKNTAAI